MGKKKGLEEDQLKDFTDETLDKPPAEDKSKTENSSTSIDSFKASAGTPEDQINIIQGIRVAALSEAVATSSALDVAVEYKELLKDTAQTAAQTLRANAEAKKGDGVSELAEAIAANNIGLNKKNVATSVSPTSVNPVTSEKPSFGSNIKSIEMTEDSSSPEYDSIMGTDDKKSKK